MGHDRTTQKRPVGSERPQTREDAGSPNGKRNAPSFEHIFKEIPVLCDGRICVWKHGGEHTRSCYIRYRHMNSTPGVMSASILTTFQSLLGKSVGRTSPETDRPHLRPYHLNGRKCHQDVAIDMKTDSNLKVPCQGCMVDDASNLTLVRRVSRRSSH
ncbi:hypothetical protein TNCV_3114061 [Trichonephila clavipes]|nr:hypothetical protein TNCV_3114061 [Trichonephila clavipes]